MSNYSYYPPWLVENIQRNKVAAKGRELVPRSPGVSGAGELSPLPRLFTSKPQPAPASTGRPRHEGSVAESPAKGGQECRGEVCSFRPNQPADYERSSGCFSRPPHPLPWGLWERVSVTQRCPLPGASPGFL